MLVKRAHHVSLCVTDVTKARGFYGDLLGLPEIPARLPRGSVDRAAPPRVGSARGARRSPPAVSNALLVTLLFVVGREVPKST